MSTINITVGNSNAGVTIDVERMTDRLNMLKDRLQSAIDRGLGDPDELQDRMNKIDSQLERINQYSGQDVNVSAGTAAKELERGINQLDDGMRFLGHLGDQVEHGDALGEKLKRWQETLFDHQGRLNTFG